MNITQKALNYLKQRGIDTEAGLNFYAPFTRHALHDMVKADIPNYKVTSRTTKAELMAVLFLRLHRNAFTARQLRRLGNHPALVA